MPRFLALIATSLLRSHFSLRLPRRRYVPSSGFLNRPTFYSALELAGLFHPAATSRVPPVQGLLSSRSHPSSLEGACLQAVEPLRAHRLAPVATRLGPRLRGLHPRVVAFDASPLFTEPHVAPLLGFLSSRLSQPTVDRRLPAISAHDVCAPCLRFRAHTARPSSACLPQITRRIRLRFAGLLEVSSHLSDPPCDRMVRLATRLQLGCPNCAAHYPVGRVASPPPGCPSFEPASRWPEKNTIQRQSSARLPA
jgi:hypothetical protein